ncbi:MAG: M50 family metallopeptidase, partial [Candidatus Colwellbacteria bacterium]|nr:M50 family metallopeptidase [Candidatus Colwellbacteria bacterium]
FPIWKRMIVFSSGVAVNFIIGWIAFSLIYAIGASPAVYVSGIDPESSAASAGIKAGDRFTDFNKIDDLVEFIKNHPGEEVSWNIDRYGEKIAVIAEPRTTDEGVRLGVELIESGFEKQGILAALSSGFTAAIRFTGKIISSFAYMFRHGDFSSSSGPIGVWNAVAIAKDMGAVYIFQLLGVVSLNLMVINFLPLPALDGGHILFLTIEKIRRKPISSKVQSSINSVSFILLLILMFIVTIRDIIRLF